MVRTLEVTLEAMAAYRATLRQGEEQAQQEQAQRRERAWEFADFLERLATGS